MQRRDELSRALLHGSAVALFVTAFAQGLGFLTQVVLARLMGVTEFGYFSYAMAWLAVGLILGKLGYDTALVRFVAEYRAQGAAHELVGVVRHGRRITLAAAVVVAAVGLLAVLALAPEPAALRHTLLLAAVLLPFAVMSEIAAAAVRGFRRVGVALAGDGVVRPLVLLAFVAFWYAQGSAVLAQHATLAYLCGTAASLAMTAFVLRREMPTAPAVAAAAPVGAAAWNAAALPLMLANGFLVLLYSIDVLMLGWLADTTQSGFYNIASKVAILVLFAMNASQSIAAPMLAGAFAANAERDARRIVAQMNLIAAAVAVPLTLVLAAFAEPLLGLLGQGFESAADCLRILALMQVINVLTGPVGTILTMSGRQQHLVRLLGGGLALNFILNLVLIPALGAEGAAWSALIAHTAWNVVGARLIATELRLDCTFMALLRRRAA